MKTITIYQADAFTDQLFGGNPAAVCPLQEWLPEEIMQQIAAENNLAETAFFVPKGHEFELRWFTPTSEIDLCGHATLAAAHILFTHLGYQADSINFHSLKSGILTVSKEESVYTLNFPSQMPVACETPAGLIEALGGKAPVEILRSRDYFLVYDTEEYIKSITPDFNALSKIETVCVIVTARGNTCDFVSRVFAPAIGILEDPVTGSAHCNLIPYWAGKLQKTKLYAFQVSSRKGELWCELKGDRVLISGKVVTYLKGEIYV